MISQKIISFPFSIQCPKKDYPKRAFKIIEQSCYDNLIYKALPFNCELHSEVAILILDQYSKDNLVQSLELLSQNDAESTFVSIYDYFEKENKFYIIMELAQQSFPQYLNSKLSIQQKYKLCQAVVEAVYDLHEKGIVHGQLSPQRFALIDQQIKLVNFGILTNTSRMNQVSYQSPEERKNNKAQTKHSDIWTLGCIMYEILAGKQLFDINSKTNEMKEQEKFINEQIQELQVFRSTKKFLLSMLNMVPEKRENLKTIIEHLNDSQRNLEDHYNLLHSYFKNDNLDQVVLDLKYHYEANYLNSNLIPVLDKLISSIQKQQRPTIKPQNPPFIPQSPPQFPFQNPQFNQNQNNSSFNGPLNKLVTSNANQNNYTLNQDASSKSQQQFFQTTKIQQSQPFFQQ